MPDYAQELGELENTTRLLMVAIQANLPILLWGPPGRGKSSLINAMARSWGTSLGLGHSLNAVTFVGSTSEPSDFGFPYILNGVSHRAATDWVIQLNESADRDGHSILFLDELTTCTPLMRAAMLRIVLDRVVGAVPLHPGVIVVAAANDPEHAPNATDLDAALANRFLHIPMKKNYLDFIAGSVARWPDPEWFAVPADWKNNLDAAIRTVCAYLAVNSGDYYDCPTDLSKAGKAWASDRTWNDFVYPIIAIGMSLGLDLARDSLIRELVAAAVGPDKAMKLQTFLRDADLPDPEALLADPDSVQPMTRGDQTWTMLIAVYSALQAIPTADRWDRTWRIVDRVYDQGQKEISTAVSFLLMPLKRTIAGAKTPPNLTKRYGRIIDAAKAR